MAGLPPFNGFLSKEMFFDSVLNVRNLDIFAMGTVGNFIPCRCLDCECIDVCL